MNQQTISAIEEARQQFEEAKSLALLREQSREDGEDGRMARIARFNQITEKELSRPVTNEELQTDLGERSRYVLLQSLRKDNQGMPHHLVNPDVIKRSGSHNRSDAPIGECWECGKDIHSSTEIRTSRHEKQGMFCDLDCENTFDYKTQNGTELEDDYTPSWDEYREDSSRSDRSVAHANYRDKAIRKQLLSKEARRRMWEDSQMAMRENETARVQSAGKTKPNVKAKGKK